MLDADILLAMNQEAADEYSEKVKHAGVVILDTTFVKQIPKTPGRIIGYPFTLKTKEQLGSTLPTNIVVLAVISQVGELVSKEALVQAIKKRGPRVKEEMNLQALNLGFELLETGALETRRRR